MQLSELYLDRYLYRDNDQDSETKDSAFVAADSSEADPSYLASGGAAQDINTGNVQIDGGAIEPGTIPADVLDVANWGWGQTCVFVSATLNTVTWGAGIFTSANGIDYAIGAGTTPVMAAKTYIFLDLNVSEVAYQTTTVSADSVGTGRVLIAVAENGATEATYNLTEANQIVGDNILANTINATKMQTGVLVVGTGVAIGTAFATADAGALATEDLVGEALLDTTVIVGGFIKTSLLTANNIITGTLTVSSSLIGIIVNTGGDIEFNSDSGSSFSAINFNQTSVSNKGWELFFTASTAGGYQSGDFHISPMSNNDSNRVRFGALLQTCDVIVNGDVFYDIATLYSVSAPGITTNKLYNVSGTLTWNGTALGTTSGTVTSVGTSGAITGGTITSTGTISHLTSAGFKHIPTSGSSQQFLKYNSSGTAVWSYLGATANAQTIVPTSGTANLGNTTFFWDNIYGGELNLKAKASSPTSAGDISSYSNGGTEQFRGIPGNSSFLGSFDLTAA